mmetsp:Transcript_22678/g.61418  ORF Transcript_22678/g.61418 Transcript_22678/m.61418 type:complete len:225 (+) Transcript_22678:708-1382(+)
MWLPSLGRWLRMARVHDPVAVGADEEVAEVGDGDHIGEAVELPDLLGLGLGALDAVALVDHDEKSPRDLVTCLLAPIYSECRPAEAVGHVHQHLVVRGGGELELGHEGVRQLLRCHIGGPGVHELRARLAVRVGRGHALMKDSLFFKLGSKGADDAGDGEGAVRGQALGLEHLDGLVGGDDHAHVDADDAEGAHVHLVLEALTLLAECTDHRARRRNVLVHLAL